MINLIVFYGEPVPGKKFWITTLLFRGDLMRTILVNYSP